MLCWDQAGRTGQELELIRLDWKGAMHRQVERWMVVLEDFWLVCNGWDCKDFAFQYEASEL